MWRILNQKSLIDTKYTKRNVIKDDLKLIISNQHVLVLSECSDIRVDRNVTVDRRNCYIMERLPLKWSSTTEQGGEVA